MHRGRIQLGAEFLIAMCVTIILLKFAPWSFGWSAALWTVVALHLAHVMGGRWQAIGILAACVPLTFFVGELVVTVITPTAEETITPKKDRGDGVLGWRHVENQSVRVIRKLDGAVLYDVTYTIDGSGRRISPPDRGEKIEGCAIFFAEFLHLRIRRGGC